MFKDIFLDAPNVGETEKKYVNEALDMGYVSTIGPFVARFECGFADYLGVRGAVSTQSGTAALHMALHELGIGVGDEVIVPALTFVATVNPVLYVGATPVFADVDPVTWNIAPDEIEKNITKRTKAIIPVHLYGNPCDMDSIMSIADNHDLRVIEDATESLGARYHGRYTGTFGDMGCFSFNGNKTMTTGGGGMVTSSDERKIGHIKYLINQAKHEDPMRNHSEIGFNYRMTNIEAAMGLAQMERFEGFLQKKIRINRIYRLELGALENITFQEEYPGSESSWWLTCVKMGKGIDIDVLQVSLKKKGVPTRRMFRPVTDFVPYRGLAGREVGNSAEIYDRGLCLPGSTLNEEEQISYVCGSFKAAIREAVL